MNALQLPLVLPRQLPDEMNAGVTRGDWQQSVRVSVAVAVSHPDGGFTVAVPSGKPGDTTREYRGRYASMDHARTAAEAHNNKQPNPSDHHEP
jgi:hypothetical protein